MADFWLFFVTKINKSTQKVLKYISILFNNILRGTTTISKDSFSQIEIQKLKWELNFFYKKLGSYIFKCNKVDGAYDFSNDENFIKLIKKIKEIENFIDTKNKN
tara:strand:- start:12483 stop:12794 length:312 start_codon:yes stop_codon:yes gene_type:complete